MRNVLLNRTSRLTSGLLGLALLVTTPLASAEAGPWLAGPSVASVGAKATLNGGNFAPGTVIQIRTSVEGSGQMATTAVNAGADGGISYAFVPASAGNYSVSAVDGTGNVLASTKLISR